MFFDPLYFLFMIPGVLIALWAQAKVTSTFARYNKVSILNGMTGAQAAREILDANGLQEVRIERVSGDLTDHFDPATNIIRLSDVTYNQPTVGAVGVAAHECGHAIQYATGYAPIKLRAGIIPICQIGSVLSMPLIIFGFAFTLSWLVTVGIVMFSLVALFQLVTLPVEFNASRRAVQTLNSYNMVTPEESKGVKSVLDAAALTYVAALLSTLLQLLYYVVRAGGNRRRN